MTYTCLLCILISSVFTPVATYKVMWYSQRYSCLEPLPICMWYSQRYSCLEPLPIYMWYSQRYSCWEPLPIYMWYSLRYSCLEPLPIYMPGVWLFQAPEHTTLIDCCEVKKIQIYFICIGINDSEYTANIFMFKLLHSEMQHYGQSYFGKNW